MKRALYAIALVVLWCALVAATPLPQAVNFILGMIGGAIGFIWWSNQ